MTVAVVGTGRMGAAMVGRLTGAGHQVVAYNRSRARAEKLGVAVADTPRDAAAGADAVVVSLADDAAVGSVYRAADGLAAGLSEGAVVLETSTVHPDTVRALAPLVTRRGATSRICNSRSAVPTGANRFDSDSSTQTFGRTEAR